MGGWLEADGIGIGHERRRRQEVVFKWITVHPAAESASAGGKSERVR